MHLPIAVAPWPHAASHGFVDDDHGRGAARLVGGREAPALHDFDAQDVEELWSRSNQMRQLPPDIGRIRHPRHADGRHVKARERNGAYRRRRGHAGHGANPLQRRREDLGLSVDSLRAMFEPDENGVGESHAEILRHEVVEAAGKHPRAREQRHGQCCLHKQQRHMRAAAPSRERRAAEINRTDRPRQLQDADDRGDRKGDEASGQPQGGSAPRQAIGFNHALEQQLPDGLAGPRRQRKGAQRRYRGDNRRLQHDLQREPGAGCAQRGTNRRLPVPPAAAHQQKRRGIRQADGEDEERDAHQRVRDSTIVCGDVTASDGHERHAPFECGGRLLGCRYIHLRRDSANHADDVAEGIEIPARRPAHRRRDRHPGVDPRRRMSAEARWHDAGYAVLDPIDRNSSSDHAWIAAERRPPERVADDRRLSRRLIVGLINRAAHACARAQHVEVRPGHHHRFDMVLVTLHNRRRRGPPPCSYRRD